MSEKPQYKLNKTFELRLAANADLLKKPLNPVAEQTDEDDFFLDLNQPGKKGKHEKFDIESSPTFNEGVELYKNFYFSDAIECFTECYQSHKDETSLFYRANCYYKLQKYTEALEDVNEILANSPNNIKAILLKAEIYFSMGEYEFALVFYQKGADLKPDNHAFQRGVSKARHSILETIDGEDPLFSPNPNLFSERPAKAGEPSVNQTSDSSEKLSTRQSEKTSTRQPSTRQPSTRTISTRTDMEESDIKASLGELSADYEFLLQLQSEVTKLQIAQQKKIAKGEDVNCQTEDELQIIIKDALSFLDQKGKNWMQHEIQPDNELTNTPNLSGRMGPSANHN